MVLRSRAFTRQNVHTLGNAGRIWYAIRYGYYFLSRYYRAVFIQQGVPQNLSVSAHHTTLEGAKQLLPMGPVASRRRSKYLALTAAVSFNASSSHPFETTALTNLAQMLAIFLIPAALCFANWRSGERSPSGDAHYWAMSFILWSA